MTHTITTPEVLPSGIDGLDDILVGGFPSGRLYLVQGTPGAGKTTLALQFLLQGVGAGDTCLYITLSETEDEIAVVARSHGWSLDGIELLEMSAVGEMLNAESQSTVFHPSDVELKAVAGLVRERTLRTRPRRVVFDSLSEFRLLAETPLRYRHRLLELKRFFSSLGCTVLLLDDKNFSVEASDPHVLSLAHGVIDLHQTMSEYGASRRRLCVTKLRGVKYRDGYHDYVIETGGLRVFPRLVLAERRGAFTRESISSDIVELDQLLGGGLDRGTTTLFMGSAGTGKTTLAMLFAKRMAERGERSLLFTFDETLGIMLDRARALGLDLEPHVRSGLLVAQQVDPAELSPGEFADRVTRGVQTGSRLVLIDSLNGYLNAMPGEQYLNSQLHELTTFLNQQGVVTLLVLTVHGLLGHQESTIDLSYLADTVVNFRFFEVAGAVKRAVTVVKKRSGTHERTIRELGIESGAGVRVGPPLVQFHGVLTGMPVFHGDADDILHD